MNQNKDEQANQGWLNRLLRQAKGNRDVIATQVSGDIQGSNIVGSKNVIQIGTLQLPIFLAIILGAGTITGLGVLLWIAFSTNSVLKLMLMPTPTPTLMPTPISTSTPLPTETPTPVVMPAGMYNIIVSELIALDLNHRPVANPEAIERAMGITAYLSNEITFIDQVRQITGEQPLIWGPAQHIPVIMPEHVAEKAKALQAKLIIYGYLQQISETKWALKPSFYLTSDSLSFEGNLFGEYSFSDPIPYSPTDQSSIHDLTTQLESLLRNLTLLVVGISYYEHDTAEAYCQAAVQFQVAADRNGEEQANLIHYCPPGFLPQESTKLTPAHVLQNPEKAIANLFLANTYLQLAFMSAQDTNATERVAALLQMARSTYNTGQALRPEVVRFYAGLGQVAYYEARLQQKPTPWLKEDCGHVDFTKLESARKSFETTIEVITSTQSPKVNTPNVSLHTEAIASLGLGRIYELLYRCTKNITGDSFVQSYQHYTRVIDLYTPQPKFYLLKPVVYAYAELGSLLLWHAQHENLTGTAYKQITSEANNDLKQAYSLAQNSHSDALLKDLKSNTIYCLVFSCK